MATYEENKQMVIKFMQSMYHQMVEQPDGLITRPFLSPGPAYGGQLWDWDFNYYLKGLIDLYEFCKDDPDFDAETLKDIIIRHGKGGVETFVEIQYPSGFTPIMISNTGAWWDEYTRTVALTDGDCNMHKPFFCRSVALVSDFTGDMEWLRGCYPALKNYLAYYDMVQYDARIGLYFYRNDDMIGTDNNPTVFGRPRNSAADIHLNSFMLHDLQTMARLAGQLGYEEDQRLYTEKADALAQSIQKHCYCQRDGFYYTVDRQVQTNCTEQLHRGMEAFWNCLPIRLRVWGGFLPMMVGVPTPEQAERLVKKHFHDPFFLSPYGIRSLSADEPMYFTEPTQNPSNFCGPIWVQINYCVCHGLLKYGYRDEAEQLCAATLELLAKNIREQGKVAESYDPEDGSPKLLAGDFMGFNILVMSMLRELRDAEAL